METELWKQSYRLPNNLFAMGSIIFELWVMKTENWVVEIACPNMLLFSFPLIHSFHRSSVRKTFSQHYSFFFFLSNPFLPTQISSRKMPIEMPKGLPFSVDTWTSSSKRKRRHFLTHAHKDHSFGISSQFSFPIYSTLLTKSLVLQHYPQVCLCFQGFFYFF